jgi:hypothetical protein
MREISRIKIFVSSPSDVKSERKIVLDVVDEINKIRGLHQNFHVDCYVWEGRLLSGWGGFQEKINPELEDTDIFVGILWSSLGTPTKDSKSGTLEELKIIEELKNSGRTIEFALFRSMKPLKDKRSYKNIDKVEDFLKEHNGKTFTVKEYHNIKQFRVTLKEHLESKIETLISFNKKDKSIVNIKSLKEHGVTRIYTPELNNERNEDKKEFLKTEDDIYLLAHTGNAYFNRSQVTPFSVIVESNITRYKHFRIILLNPYSLEARKIYFAENFGVHNNEITDIKIKGGLDSGNNMKRFIECLEAIEDFKSKNTNIEVRISNVATDGTILMSRNKLFYEPYLSSRFLNRINRGLNIFEFQVENKGNINCEDVYSNFGRCNSCNEEQRLLCSKNLYKTISEQFHILWKISVPLEEYEEQENKYKETFLNDHDGLFKNEIIQLHDSWFAFDPIIGCQNNCCYCFLGTNGWRKTNPKSRITSDESATIKELINIEYASLQKSYLYKTLIKKKLPELGSTPISIGNKTDILQKSNKECLNSFFENHRKSAKRAPIVLITKEVINKELINEIKDLNYDIYLFNSLSYLSKECEPGVKTYSKRLNELKIIRNQIDAENISNVKLIQYWRPITDLSELGYKEILDNSKDIFHCTIGIGLKVFQKLQDYFRKSNPKFYSYVEKNRKRDVCTEDEEIFPASYDKAIKYSKEIGHPFFKHTSCAICFLQNKADFNGSMWRKGFCDFCDDKQKIICDKFKTNYYLNSFQKTKETLESLTNAAIKDSDEYIEIIDKELTQEEITLYTHIAGKPVYTKYFKYSRVWKSSNQKYIESLINANANSR